jgi:ParB family transcriptional regulator, chromosome partitioning protein
LPTTRLCSRRVDQQGRLHAGWRLPTQNLCIHGASKSLSHLEPWFTQFDSIRTGILLAMPTGVAVEQLQIALISPSPRNVRRKMRGIEGLAASIATYGLLQPVVVRRVRARYELVAGHRRLEAARQLGWTTIAAVVRSEAADAAYVLTLIENLQREDLSPREEADALEILIRERSWSTRQVAGAIKRSQAFVSKRLRVFEDPMLAPAVLANRLSVSGAEELLTVPERRRYDLLARAIEGDWDSVQIRQAIKGELATSRTGRPRGLAGHVLRLRDELRAVQPEALTEADRRALRLLFKELAMLARAKPGSARVFPPIPEPRRNRAIKSSAR